MTWKMRNADCKTLKLWEKGSLEPASGEKVCDLFGVVFGEAKASAALSG